MAYAAGLDGAARVDHHDAADRRQPEWLQLGDFGVTFFDANGRPVWSKDAAGVISYVHTTRRQRGGEDHHRRDTDNSGDFANLPSGWSSPSGLHLISTFEVDCSGG